jgi:hypothetical protein
LLELARSFKGDRPIKVDYFLVAVLLPKARLVGSLGGGIAPRIRVAVPEKFPENPGTSRS